LSVERDFIGSTVSHYRVLERLGAGGMGEVYKAWDLSLERFAALKVFTARGRGDDAYKRRFIREARTASILDHPNICTVYEAGETTAGELFIAMAFCPGESLKQLLLRRGSLPVHQAIEVASQVAAGLGQAHEQGVVHRDVKPANIMLAAGEGQAVVVDFGIARRADHSRLTRSGEVMGTTAYIAPERFLGAEADARSDIWSLGVVLYEMVTGSLPFRSPTDRDLVAEILHREIEPMAALRPGIPAELERIVARALAKRPAGRYQRACELGAALRNHDLNAALRDDLNALRARDLNAGGAASSAEPAEETVAELAYRLSGASGEAPGGGGGKQVGPTVAHYHILELLGGGGMGVVYKAKDTRLGRCVALKFLPAERTRDPHAKARFMQEARAASALDHPNICTIHEVGETADGQLFLAMACYDGETLKRRLERGALPLAEAIDFGLQTARGLAKAHQQGIVHRDVKPANLMITGDGIVKILDFGIAKLAGATALTRAGSMLGTPAYMSPEQAFGDAVDARTDLWSLGAVLYEMLAGRRPFRGEHEQAVLYSLLHADPEPLDRLRPETPPELSRVIGRLLAKEPRQRCQGAAEVIAGLQALAGSAPGARPGLAGSSAGALGSGPGEALAPVQDSLAEAPTEAPSTPRVAAERRQLTVLRCDVLPTGAEGEALDAEDLPEVLHDLMPEIDKTYSQVLARYAGHVARRLAAGLLVYFGYPVAHEDDSRRAVHAALEIRAAARELSARFAKERGIRLEARAGIHTGLVVGPAPSAPGSAPQVEVAQGAPPAVAERLLGLAEADEVVVSDATRRLIDGFFDTESLGPARLTGSREEQQTYRVVRESGAATRFQVELRKGLTPLVGRAQEIALVLERWAAAREERGQVVMLTAEAGIGKSRLLEEIRQRIGEESCRWIECRCSPYHQNSAFYPLTAMLSAWLRLERGSSDADRLHCLESRLAGFAAAREQIPLLASLLSIPYEQRHPPLELDPRERRQKTLEVLSGMVLEDSLRQPVALVIEDLHWADPSTLDWLDLVVGQVAANPILALLAFRPDFTPPAAWRAHASQISLGGLNREQVVEMIGKITGGKALPPQVAEEVFRKTEGVPLFVEDLTRMVVESGLVEERSGAYALNAPLQPLAIPDSLQETLMARLERLETARPIAQLAATIGREFLYEMLREVAALDDLTLGRELDRLVAAGLLYRRGLPRRATYLFKHALIQEALVHSLLKRQRCAYHKLIAEALGRSFPEIAASQPELVAYHLTEAGQIGPAIDYWLKAAQLAIQVSAYRETIEHAKRGLDLLAELPEGLERNRRELLLRAAQGPALSALQGWASPESGACFNRALALCHQIGSAAELSPIQYGLWTNLLVGGRLREALAMGNELLTTAQATGDDSVGLMARDALCTSCFFLGDPTAACEHGRLGLAIYDRDRHHAALTRRYGQDPVPGLTYLALGLWQLGYPDQSVALGRKMRRLADAFDHRFSRAFLLGVATFNFQQMRDVDATEESNDEALSLAADFQAYQAIGPFIRGWAIAARGRAEEGIAMMKSAIDAWHAAAAGTFVCLFPCLLAETYLRAGRHDEARHTVDLALETASGHEERNHWSELHRLEADLLRLGGAPAADVEDWLERSRRIARQQRARAFELRTAMSLAHLLRDQGKRPDARRQLAAVYETFTEGFSTPDLVAARELLTALS
jgi:TOMM system kinase/cyclase fusion protein